MADTTFIYALKEPDTGEIRYIGKADNPQNRLFGHLADKSRSHRTNWLRSLRESGQKPALEILDEVPVDLHESAEMGYIFLYNSQGCRLVNGTPGGEGPPSTAGKKMPPRTPEHCAKISAALTGKKKSPEHCAKVSAALTGKKLSPEHCAKMSASGMGRPGTNTGRKLTPEWRTNISKAQKDSKLTLAHCAKMSAANIGRKLPLRSLEHCLKLSAAKRGHKLSPEHCAAISAGKIGKKRGPYRKK